MKVGTFLFAPDENGFSSMARTKITPEKLRVLAPKDGEVFRTAIGEGSKLITVAGSVDADEIKPGRHILVVIRTNRDYPQAMGEARVDGTWEFPECRLGGVDHEVYAVLLDENDDVIYASTPIKVRLFRSLLK